MSSSTLPPSAHERDASASTTALTAGPVTVRTPEPATARTPESVDPEVSLPHARGTVAAFAAATLLPMLALAALALAGVIDGETLSGLTPAVMLLPALAAISLWSLTRSVPLGRALRVRPERGWLRAIAWSLIALVLVGALGAATAGLAVLLGIAQPSAGWQAVLPAVPAVLGTMLALSLAEEVGWRGFAQRLLAPMGFLRASFAIAAFWALWHAPAMAVWVLEGSMPLAAALATLGSLVLGGLVLSALSVLGGSVWPAVVGHAAMNSLVVFATSTMVTGEAAAIGATGWIPWALAALALLLLALRRAPRARRTAVV